MSGTITLLTLRALDSCRHCCRQRLNPRDISHDAASKNGLFYCASTDTGLSLALPQSASRSDIDLVVGTAQRFCFIEVRPVPPTAALLPAGNRR